MNPVISGYAIIALSMVSDEELYVELMRRRQLNPDKFSAIQDQYSDMSPTDDDDAEEGEHGSTRPF